MKARARRRHTLHIALRSRQTNRFGPLTKRRRRRCRFVLYSLLACVCIEQMRQVAAAHRSSRLTERLCVCVCVRERRSPSRCSRSAKSQRFCRALRVRRLSTHTHTHTQMVHNLEAAFVCGGTRSRFLGYWCTTKRPTDRTQNSSIIRSPRSPIPVSPAVVNRFVYI